MEKKFLLRIFSNDVVVHSLFCLSVLEAEKEFKRFKSIFSSCGHLKYKIYSLVALKEGE